MNTMVDEIRAILAESLQLGARADSLQANSPLLGNLPELDSMAVVNVITALEEQYGLVFDDDEISAEIFETLSELASFVEQKIHS